MRERERERERERAKREKQIKIERILINNRYLFLTNLKRNKRSIFIAN